MEAKAKTSRVCDICGKGFSSGKAYGGHYRSHLLKARQAANEDQQQEEETVPRRVSINNIPKLPEEEEDLLVGYQKPGGVVPCGVCDKGFSSKKALGGHMRSHPGRDWRGINPPRPSSGTEISSSSCSSESNGNPNNDIGSNIDLTQVLVPSWVRREKRGRVQDSEVVKAAEILFYMSRSGMPFTGVSSSPPPLFEDLHPQKKLKIKADSSLKFRIVNSTTVTSNDCRSKGKHVVSDQDDDDEMKSCNSSSSSSSSDCGSLEMDESASSLLDSANGNQKITVDGNTDSSLLYKCVDCKKSFSTFQGLGGHRSTHNKYPNNNKKIRGIDAISPSLMHDNPEENRDKFQAKISNGDNKIASKRFRLPRDGRDFKVGNGTRHDRTQSSNRRVEIRSTTRLGFHGGRLPDFDLNEVPCVKVDDEIDAM